MNQILSASTPVDMRFFNAQLDQEALTWVAQSSSRPRAVDWLTEPSAVTSDCATDDGDTVRPCPFCGSINAIVVSANLALTSVWCLDCDAHGPTGTSERSATAAWNQRIATAQIARLEQRLAAVESALEGYRAQLQTKLSDAVAEYLQHKGLASGGLSHARAEARVNALGAATDLLNTALGEPA